MSDETIDTELQPMTLATVADGELEVQFQERLRKALELLTNFRRLTPSSDGTYTAVIKMEVGITLDPADGTYTQSARALHPKGPSPRVQVRDAYRRGDSLKVRPELKQGILPPMARIGSDDRASD